MKYKFYLLIAIISLLTACCCGNGPSGLSASSGSLPFDYAQPGSTNTSLGPDEHTTLLDVGASPDGFDITSASKPNPISYV